MILQPGVSLAQSLTSDNSTNPGIDPGFNPNLVLDDNDIFEIGSMTLSRLQALMSAKGTLGGYRARDIDGVEKSAAEIIWRVAGSYQINPRYLLAVMQKEQSLVEDPNPTQKQFDWAMGYGVCDSCSLNDPSIQDYKGFANQVEWAAKQYREKYLMQILGSGKTISGIAPGKTVMIDGQAVTPANNATAMLYTYTPHINGNLNLWRIWQRWFSLSFPDGSVVKAADSGKIYLIRFGEKRPFASVSIAASMTDTDKIITANEHDLSGYPNGDAIQFPNYALIETPDHTRYLIVGDKKRRFASASVFQALGFISDELIDATPADLTSYEDGPDITRSTVYPVGILVKDAKKNLWYIEDNIKHAIPNASLVKLYFNGWPAKAMTAKQLNAFTQGDDYKLHDGELIRTKDDPAVYVMENGLRRPIPSGDIFEALGWNWKNVVTLPTAVVTTYPMGNPVQLYTPAQVATVASDPSTSTDPLLPLHT